MIGFLGVGLLREMVDCILSILAFDMCLLCRLIYVDSYIYFYINKRHGPHEVI